MTPEEKREALKNHPNTIELEYAGYEAPWFFGKRTLDLAREEGLDPNALLSLMQLGDEEDIEEDQGVADTIGELMDGVSELIWIGYRVLDPDIELEWVKLMMTGPQITNVMQQIGEKLSVDVDVPESKKKDPAG